MLKNEIKKIISIFKKKSNYYSNEGRFPEVLG
jgi:hypothetical protein